MFKNYLSISTLCLGLDLQLGVGEGDGEDEALGWVAMFMVRFQNRVQCRVLLGLQLQLGFVLMLRLGRDLG